MGNGADPHFHPWEVATARGEGTSFVFHHRAECTGRSAILDDQLYGRAFPLRGPFHDARAAKAREHPRSKDAPHLVAVGVVPVRDDRFRLHSSNGRTNAAYAGEVPWVLGDGKTAVNTLG